MKVGWNFPKYITFEFAATDHSVLQPEYNHWDAAVSVSSVRGPRPTALNPLTLSSHCGSSSRWRLCSLFNMQLKQQVRAMLNSAHSQLCLECLAIVHSIVQTDKRHCAYMKLHRVLCLNLLLFLLCFFFDWNISWEESNNLKNAPNILYTTVGIFYLG